MSTMTSEREAFGRWFYASKYAQVALPGADDVQRAWDAWQARAHLAQPAQAVDVDSLAQEIRRVDGSHSLGAAALAEALTPFITRALSGEKAGPVGGWQPIETAPINETVFCYHPMVGRFPGYQSRIDGTSAVTWHNTWSQESGVMPPTHWQPLPASPAPDKEG